MFHRRGFIGLVVAALGFLAFGAADANAQSVRYFVFANGGTYEIREGSGTGGRFVSQPRSIGGIWVNGYTDRAARGEYIMVRIEGSGRADYVGVKSDNNVLNAKVFNVTLPATAFGRVWLSPHVDNVYTSVKMPGQNEYRRRLPIGSR